MAPEKQLIRYWNSARPPIYLTSRVQTRNRTRAVEWKTCKPLRNPSFETRWPMITVHGSASGNLIIFRASLVGSGVSSHGPRDRRQFPKEYMVTKNRYRKTRSTNAIWGESWEEESKGGLRIACYNIFVARDDAEWLGWLSSGLVVETAFHKRNMFPG